MRNNSEILLQKGQISQDAQTIKKLKQDLACEKQLTFDLQTAVLQKDLHILELEARTTSGSDTDIVEDM
jgi:hypothetical protein